VKDACPSNPPVDKVGAAGRQALGETCAPPVSSQFYFRDSGVIGAFATDLLLSPLPSDLVSPTLRASSTVDKPVAASTFTDRLFAPVRGSATLTWATVVRDDPNTSPGANKRDYPPFAIQCGQDAGNRCDHAHAVGEDTTEFGNDRKILLPGEPFGATISEDGTSLVMTHQSDPKVSLFDTGMGFDSAETAANGHRAQTPPSLKFVVENAPYGGVGIVPVPHDPDAFLGAPSLPRPAYYETHRSAPQVTLIRQYADTNLGTGASQARPFLTVEGAFPVSASAGAVDSRGVAIDVTPRLACKAKITATDPAERDKQLKACARKPARIFIANRTPSALLVGDIGGNAVTGDDAYDPDRLQIHTSVPLSAGPSKVYLAPIVDKNGNYALRVFAVCFDSATVYVYDPEGGVLEQVIRVGLGPFAMAFDPFNLDDVAQHKPVPIDQRPGPDEKEIRHYRFAYLASFTQSYVQLIDLDNAVPATKTFEQVVFTLGLPTNPKGT
jgi:DNA-binding beta-propeller fold protein YncE